MKIKEVLVLFLIHSEPGIKGVRILMRILDRVSFPFGIGPVLENLLKTDQIIVTKYYDNTNRVPVMYACSDKGKNYIETQLNKKELINYIKSLDEPDFLLEIAEKYLSLLK